MTFSTFSNYLQQLEGTSAKNEMVEVLADMITIATHDEVSDLLYLSLGHLGPLYDPQLFNMSDALVIRAIAQAYDEDEVTVKQQHKKMGDLGDVAFSLNQNVPSSQTVVLVHQHLMAIAAAEGKGSVEEKIGQTAALLRGMGPLESKFVVRIILERLRMGFAEATVMDALSWVLVGDKSLRKEIEHAFNVFPDIGTIGQQLKKEGIDGLKDIKITPGVPIRPAKSERLPTPEAIIEKIGECAVEPKMDGFRAQIHVWGTAKDRRVKIFSRNLNETTDMFPEIVEAAKLLPVTEAIFDAEAIAYNPETDEFLPFQETVKRRRKHDIETVRQDVPLKAFIFDVLYLKGKSLLNLPAQERFEHVERLLGNENGAHVLLPTRHSIVTTVETFRTLFDLYVSEGLEGVMCKKLDAIYQAGARNFNWVKYKRATEKELSDSIDGVILGYYFGRGQRVRFGIGAFLIGIYDEENDSYKTVAKVGTGLSDQDWVILKKRLDQFVTHQQPKGYAVRQHLVPDVWVLPRVVVEIEADEITKSPIHTAGQAELSDTQSGLALRFPRFKQYRDDKNPDQATTEKELISMFTQQVGT